jgi:hypothetical protein
MKELEARLDELVARVERLEVRGVEAVDHDAQERFDEQTEQRVEQFRAELDLNARANAAFADAAGLDVSKIPPELLRELEQVAERTSKDEPPPLPRE